MENVRLARLALLLGMGHACQFKRIDNAPQVIGAHTGSHNAKHMACALLNNGLVVRSSSHCKNFKPQI